MINKRDIVEKFGSSKSDTGNTKVQVALLTEKINYLTSNLHPTLSYLYDSRSQIDILSQMVCIVCYLQIILWKSKIL